MSAVKAIRIVLKTNKYNIPLLIIVLKAICAAMKAHPQSYPNPPVDLVTFLAQITDLDTKQQGVKNRSVTAATRDKARDLAYASAESLRVYVAGLATVSPESAVTLAEDAAMKVASDAKRGKPLLGIKQGPHSGIALLAANVGLLVTFKGGRFFNWEWSIDGKTWTAVPSTPNGKTTISGLPALTLCYFRVSVTGVKTGQGPWTDPATFTVQ